MPNKVPSPTRKTSPKLKADPFRGLDPFIEAAASLERAEEQAGEPAGEVRASDGAPASALKPAGARAHAVWDVLKPEGISLTACPYVGIAEDPATRFMEAHPSHRCFAMMHPGSISEDQQREYCLSSRYSLCETFVAMREPARSPVTPWYKRCVQALSHWLGQK